MCRRKDRKLAESSGSTNSFLLLPATKVFVHTSTSIIIDTDSVTLFRDLISPSFTEVTVIDAPDSASAEIMSKANENAALRKSIVKRQVAFGVIEIREYSRCLGDHPVASKGPPMAIDWRYREAGSFGLDDYESSKPTARTHSEFMVPGSTRSRILKEHAGVTHAEIKAKMSEMNQVKHERKMSIAMQEFEEWTIAYESLKRKLKRLFARVSKKKEQDLSDEKPGLLVKGADSNQETETAENCAES
jgi:hypothetical protein